MGVGRDKRKSVPSRGSGLAKGAALLGDCRRVGGSLAGSVPRGR